MSDDLSPHAPNGSPERRAYGLVSGVLRSWPDWLLIVCFVFLGVAFALAGKLDDWLRIFLAVTFFAIVVALLGRFHLERTSNDAPPPPPS